VREKHIAFHAELPDNFRMGADDVAMAFAAWVTAHKAHVEAHKRLLAADGISRKMGTQPPQELLDEVAALKKEDERLLAAANKALAGTRATGA
jgi:hypothetical protein